MKHFGIRTLALLVFTVAAGRVESAGSRMEGEPGGENRIGIAAAWSRLDPDVAFGGNAAILDSSADQVIVLADRTDEIWRLDLATLDQWVREPIAGVRPPDRQGLPVVHDPAHERWILVRPGSLLGPSSDAEVWALELEPIPTWRLLGRGFGPGFRNFHSVALDPVTNRLFLYGGTLYPSDRWWVDPFEPLINLLDLWECDLEQGAQWRLLDLAGEPPAVAVGSATVFDGTRRRVLLAGVDIRPAGYGTTRVWSLPVDRAAGESFEWHVLAPSLSYEPMPLGMAASLDVPRNRLYLHGGLALGYSHSRPTTWRTAVLDLDTGAGGDLIHTVPISPPGRFGIGSAHDARRDRHLFIGGWRSASRESPSREVWALHPQSTHLRHGVWERVGPWRGPPHTREGEAAVFDPRRQRVLVGGGEKDWPCFSTFCNFIVHADLWSFDLHDAETGEWTALPMAPQHFEMYGRTLASLSLDDAKDRLLLFGGAGGAPSVLHVGLESISLTPSGAWDRVATTEPSPLPRFGHGAVVDSRRGRLLVLDGASGFSTASPPRGDAWGFDLAGAGEWTAIPLTPGSPGPGKSLEAAYDAERDRVLAVTRPPTPTSTYAAWELDLGSPVAWRALPMLPGSAPRGTARACFDPVRSRMLLFEDVPASGAAPQRVVVWALEETNPARWIEVAAGPSPTLPGLATGPVVYDGVHDRFVLPNAGPASEVWAFTFGAPRWPIALSWYTRGGGRIGMEPGGAVSRIVVHGGSPKTSWIHPRPVELSSFDPAAFAWSGVTMELDPVGVPRMESRDVDGDGAVDLIFDVRRLPLSAETPIALDAINSAGARINGTLDPLVAVLQHSTRQVPSLAADPLALALALSVPAPFRPDSRLKLRAGDVGTVEVSVHDVRGRRIAHRSIEPSRNGEQELGWPELTAVPPGVYLVRASQGSRAATSRLIRL